MKHIFRNKISKFKKTFLFAVAASISVGTSAQNYHSPLDIPLLLSANCGELRNNHFHGGLDIKTQMAENKRVLALENGYVSRISVSPSGYGLAIYIDYPAYGHTSVYGHLNSYAPEIAQYVKEQQYAQESFSVNLILDKNKFPVKRGQLVAYSGNTGSSGGPHVHFEIRDTKTQTILDPLQYFKSEIKDFVAPEIRGIAVYPIMGKGVVNNLSRPYRLALSKSKKGEYLPIKNPIEVWGTIGLGVKAYDRMTATTNAYGVRIVKLLVDGKEIFKSDMNAFPLEKTRMINTFADFEAWRKQNEWYMKSFIEEGNTLPLYTSINKGYINIDQEREYLARYELEDLYGNKFSYDFTLVGKKQAIASPPKCSLFMPWNQDNRFINDWFSLIISKGNLYTDACFSYSKTTSDIYLSDKVQINNTPVPLHSNASIKLKLKNDTITQKNQYGIVLVGRKRDSWFGGTYSSGFVTTSIRELGNEYAVSFDGTAPIIGPVLENKWLSQKAIKLKVTDNKSGVKAIKGTIDGKFILFTNDVKSAVYTYRFDDDRLEKNKQHTLIFTAIDGCGNSTEYKYEFIY